MKEYCFSNMNSLLFLNHFPLLLNSQIYEGNDSVLDLDNAAYKRFPSDVRITVSLLSLKIHCIFVTCCVCIHCNTCKLIHCPNATSGICHDMGTLVYCTNVVYEQ